jgi:hypothetical protein
MSQIYLNRLWPLYSRDCRKAAFALIMDCEHFCVPHVKSKLSLYIVYKLTYPIYGFSWTKYSIASIHYIKYIMITILWLLIGRTGIRIPGATELDALTVSGVRFLHLRLKKERAAGRPASCISFRYRSIPVPDWVFLFRYRTGSSIGIFVHSGTGLTGCRTVRHSGIWKSFCWWWLKG